MLRSGTGFRMTSFYGRAGALARGTYRHTRQWAEWLVAQRQGAGPAPLSLPTRLPAPTLCRTSFPNSILHILGIACISPLGL